jgi:hypothetical protein
MEMFLYFSQCLLPPSLVCACAHRHFSLFLAQMYKDLPIEEPKKWKPVLIRHGQFVSRTYARIGEGRPLLGAMLPPSKRLRGAGSAPHPQQQQQGGGGATPGEQAAIGAEPPYPHRSSERQATSRSENRKQEHCQEDVAC